MTTPQRSSSGRRPVTGQIRRARPAPRPEPEDAVEVSTDDPMVPEDNQEAGEVAAPRPRLGLWIGIGVAVLVLGVAAVFAATPIRVSRALAVMDACRSDAGREDEAKLAANTWYDLVKGDRRAVMELIRQDRGPVTVQIHIAERATSIAGLLLILDRPGLNPAYRQFALAALDRQTDPPPDDPILVEDIASRIAVWLRDPLLLPGANGSAMSIYTRLRPEAAELVLFDALRQAGTDLELVNRALDGLARNLRLSKFPAYLDIATGAASRAVREHEAFYRKGLVRIADASVAEQLMPLLVDEDAAKRVVALDCMAGPSFALPAGEAGARLRGRVAAAVVSSLAVDRHLREVSAALATARRLHLPEAAEAVLRLRADLADLAPFGVSAASLAVALGDDLLKGASADQANHVVSLLTKALARAEDRPIAVAALSRVRDTGLESVKKAVEALRKLGTPEAKAAVQALTAKR